jgi:hypothetical protein
MRSRSRCVGILSALDLQAHPARAGHSNRGGYTSTRNNISRESLLKSGISMSGDIRFARDGSNDRRGRTLTYDDQLHYCNAVTSLF